MGIPIRSATIKKYNEVMKITIASIAGAILGFLLGVSFQTLSLTKVNLPSSIFPSIDLTYVENKYAWATFWGNRKIPNEFNKFNEAKIWVPSNPRGAERLPPRIIESQSDFYLRRLWGQPHEDLSIKPKYLVTFTVGYNQKNNIDAAIKKFSENFTIVLFHYDGRVNEWDEFEWSKKAIHISAAKQTKWWYAKRFLHPDIVAAYDYIFIWDEDLGMEHFDAEEYLKMVRKHALEISQPGLDPSSSFTWEMTRKREKGEVHKEAEEKNGWCSNPVLVPPCAAFVEIMAPVFSKNAWPCVWHMIQRLSYIDAEIVRAISSERHYFNDLVHGWGLDFALKKCVEPSYEKIGVVDTQWVVHQRVPSLGDQGQADSGKAPWEGVRERCHQEWTMFRERMDNAERDYFQSSGIIPLNSTGR